MAGAAGIAVISRAFDRVRLARLADWLAVAVAVSLPWSTSATSILIAAWLVALIPTLDVAMLRRELGTAAGGLPALLWLCAALGMLWAHVDFAERLFGLGGFHKLLVIPLLLAQFRRSERGHFVLYGFLASCVALLLASLILYALYAPPWGIILLPKKLPGVPVKDYIAQNAEFLVCSFGLLALAVERMRVRRFAFAVALLALAALFLADIYYVAAARTALVVIPLLLALFGLREFGWKGMAIACLAGAVLFAGLWFTSPFLRMRVLSGIEEVSQYRDDNAVTSAGLRLEFWKKSFRFIGEAPWLGHGTGSMRDLFNRSAQGESGASAVKSDNPHNQYLAVAVQLGLVGTALLIAMWIAHLALFRGPGLVAWLGIVIVVQNAVSSVFNSHLFDFLHGWLYVIGVGVLGGMAQRLRATAPPASDRAP